MAVEVINSRGQTVTLLNPSEKGAKYARELKQGVRRTNSGSFKLDKNNKAQHLTKEQRAFRSCYLTAQKDSSKCYNAKMNKKNRKHV